MIIVSQASLPLSYIIIQGCDFLSPKNFYYSVLFKIEDTIIYTTVEIMMSRNY